MRIDPAARRARRGATPSAPGWIALLAAAALLLGPVVGTREAAGAGHAPQTGGWAERMPVPAWPAWGR
jgi:hypothetical protein